MLSQDFAIPEKIGDEVELRRWSIPVIEHLPGSYPFGGCSQGETRRQLSPKQRTRRRVECDDKEGAKS